MAEKTRTLQPNKADSQVVFGAVSAEQAWTPAINVYDCGGSVHVCVELAGVKREALSVTVEPGRLIIAGRREVPEPDSDAAQCIREMQIDHGQFRQQLSLPETIDLVAVQSTYRDGLLWIVLPAKKP